MACRGIFMARFAERSAFWVKCETASCRLTLSPYSNLGRKSAFSWKSFFVTEFTKVHGFYREHPVTEEGLMRRLSLTRLFAKSLSRFSRLRSGVRWAFWGVVGGGLLSACLSTSVCAQSSETRVVWKLGYAQELDTQTRNEIESTVIKTLLRAKERHFVGDAILAQKLRNEGFNFPDCFTQGEPCSGGGTFVLDVYNVDAYADATFSRDESHSEWVVDLRLNRRFSGSEMKIHRSGKDLAELLRNVLSALFEMDAEISIESTQANLNVYLNGRFVGTAPISMRIPVGAQSVEFKRDGYVSQSWQFEAEKGELYAKSVDLVPEVTQITVLTSASQDTLLEVDGEMLGPANATYDILPGDHTVKVSAPGYHDFEQAYKVYPGNPQTMQVALLPESQSPWTIRHKNISNYRLSGFFGYKYANESLSFKDSKLDIAGKRYSPQRTGWKDADYHGFTLRLDYEDEYWGVSFFGLDFGWASFSPHDALDLRTFGGDTIRTNLKDAWMVSFYPAQIKGHYTFWVMQAEALFGIGLAHKSVTGAFSGKSFTLAQTAFSVHLNLGLKYFLSEESFVSIGYDLQFDVKDGEFPRHGVVVGLGMQFPVWMRTPSLTSSGIGDDGDENSIESEILDDGLEAPEDSKTEQDFAESQTNSNANDSSDDWEDELAP